MPATASIPSLNHFDRFFPQQRSRLYHLEPIGIETPIVESLTSYIVRLAREYRISPRTLVIQEILPLLKISVELKPENHLAWLRDTTGINGVTFLVNDWVQALEQLTLHTDLRFLTMLTWSNIIDRHCIVRNTRAWCPICYHEWLRDGKIVYDPLIWTLKVVTACPWHHQSLQVRCAHCQQTLPLITDCFKPDYCSKCAHYLGSPNRKEIAQETINEKDGEWNQWIVNSVNELIAAAPNLPLPPGKNKIATGITAYLKQSMHGSIGSIARHLGFNETTFRGWQRGLHVPKFKDFLKLCKGMGIPPLRFLTDEVNLLFDYPVKGPVHLSGARNDRLDIQDVQQELETLLKSEVSPSLKEVAKQLHYPVQVLQNLFPELCDAISQKYLKLLNPDHQQRMLEAVLAEPELQSLSLNEVARRLGCRVTLLEYRFPQLCHEIAKRHRKALDLAYLRLALQNLLECTEEPPPNINEVLLRLACSSSTLYRYFPEACHAITKRHQLWLSAQRIKRDKNSLNDDSLILSPKQKTTKRRLKLVDTKSFPEVVEKDPVGKNTSMRDVKLVNQKRRRKIVDVEQLRKELEQVLATNDKHLPTVKEVAKYLDYSYATLYKYFPDMCYAIADKHQHRNIIDIDILRRELDAILASDKEPFPSLREVSKRLGCSATTLRRNFTAQCQTIVQRHRNGLRQGNNPITRPNVVVTNEENRLKDTKRTSTNRQRKVEDFDGLRRALEEILISQEFPFPTMTEVAGRLGHSPSVLYHYFPQQCRAIAEQHKSEIRNQKGLKQALEKVLMNNKAPFPTVQEVAKNLGCSLSILYHNVPEYCHAIAKRRQLDRDYLKRSLEAILAGDECPPSVNEVARRLGCASSTLREYFPQECKEIKERHWKIADADRQRQTLEAALLSDGPTWSINEIARQLRCSNSILYNRFPELCREITNRRWNVSETDQLRSALEAALVEDPPPTLTDVASRLGYPVKNIEYYFPELCKAVTKRRKTLSDKDTQQRALQNILASDEINISLQEVARRLDASVQTLWKRFPEICAAIKERYIAFRKNGHEERSKRIRDEVRQATLLVHSRGDYPSAARVGALLSSPARFRSPEVREAWRETMRDLGYDL